MKLTMSRVVVFLDTHAKCREDEETIFPKLRVHIKDNDNSPYESLIDFYFQLSFWQTSPHSAPSTWHK